MRHQNEAVISYAAEAVVARAVSLCSQQESLEKREVIRNYWAFFRDDQHFTNWCQIGFCFNDGMKARITTRQTLIADFDHGAAPE